MSRCFPFPPPGYVVNGIRDEAMIDSIKGAEEKCKKEHRKDRKRDKKEKKDKTDKEKKDKKDKKRKEREGESEKHSHKRRRKEEEVAKDVQKNHQKVDLFRKEAENNCLEKSSLTVERELLQSTSQNSCDSTLNSNEKEKKQQPRHNNSDSALNSNELPKQKEKQHLNGTHNSNEIPKEKEKEKQQPLDGRHNNNNNDSESIIRIRLPIRRPKDPETMMMMSNKDQPCPSRDLKLDSVTREQPQHPCSTSAPVHASKPHEEKRKDHHTSTRKHKEKHREKKLPSANQENYQPSRLCRLCPPSMAEQFLNVVENWVPSTIESRVELSSSEEDECWWLVKKPTERCKQLLGRNNETKEEVISSSIAWPRARLLPEADVYALPFTVPF